MWERSRPKASYDWLYLDNPAGIARGTLVIERSSGELISTTVGFPWPVSRGDERLRGSFGGDNVTVKRLQRTGLSTIRRAMGEMHPWRNSVIGLGAPNAASRQKGVKLGDDPPLGPLPTATMVVDFQAYLRAQGAPKAAAGVVGGAANGAFALWRYGALAGAASLRAESVDRFGPEFDRVTADCMRFSYYWCPHDADFLNWRYLDHVINDYQAVALVNDRDQPQAYAVIRIDGEHGFLMEFAADSLAVAKTLLDAVVERARAAGCNRLGFYSTCGWRYWALFYRAGFRPRPSERYINASCKERDDVNVEANWQLLPGDSDVT